MHRVLIVGGGAGGLELATRLGDTLGKRGKASIALLDKARVHVWKPHLHEVASGTLDLPVDAVEYIAHARKHHYRFRLGAMCGLNREKRQVYVVPMPDEDGRVRRPPEVPEPTSGSVRPKDPTLSRATMGGSHFCFCSSEPQR